MGRMPLETSENRTLLSKVTDALLAMPGFAPFSTAAGARTKCEDDGPDEDEFEPDDGEELGTDELFDFDDLTRGAPGVAYPEGVEVHMHERRRNGSGAMQEDPLAMRFNSGKPQISYLLSAPHAVRGICTVFEYGAGKYARDNWKKGLPLNEIMDSLGRHLLDFANGVDLDEDDPKTGQKGSGLPHVHHILWNALVLAEMWETRPDLDNRTKSAGGPTCRC